MNTKQCACINCGKSEKLRLINGFDKKDRMIGIIYLCADCFENFENIEWNIIWKEGFEEWLDRLPEKE